MSLQPIDIVPPKPLGRPLRPRDERGWLVPQEFTVKWFIYTLMVNGFGTGEIARLIGHEASAVRVLASNIRHPEVTNARARAHNKTSAGRERQRRYREAAYGSISPFARKLIHAGGMSRTQAIEEERKILEKEKGAVGGLDV